MQQVVNSFNQILVKKIENIANNTSVKALPVKPDVFVITPEVKASIKEGVKKFDNPNFIQKTFRRINEEGFKAFENKNIFKKACDFVSETKVGKAIMFGVMAIAAAITGKVAADKAE
jgi:vacuolar-type H+-ATPase subunit E/Vma4